MADEALWQACSDGDIDKVDELLKDSNVDCNYQYGERMDTPIMIALRNGHTKVFNRLIQDKRVDLVNIRNSKGGLPHAMACWKGNVEAVKYLLNQPNIDFNVLNISRSPPLYFASQEGHAEIVELLLALPDIAVNQADVDGVTSLYVASQNGHASVVKRLLARPDINVNQSHNDGRTPLWMASQNKHDSVVRLLLNHPDINVNLPRTTDGVSPLWMASQKGHPAIIKLFLAMAMDLDVISKLIPGPEPWQSRTPAEQAKAHGHIKIFNLLKSFEPSNDPIETNERQAKIRNALRKELYLHVEDAAQLLALVVLLSDEYLQFQPEGTATRNEHHQKAIQFFQLNLRLPLELQTRICNLAFEHDSLLVPSGLFEEGLKAVLKLF